MKPDYLNDLGMYLINMDYRYIAIGAIVLFILLCLIRSIVAPKKNQEASTKTKGSEEWKMSAETFCAGVLSVLSLYSAVKIGAIFLLTKPPAINKLEDGEVAFLGIISLIILTSISLLGLKGFFKMESKKKQPPKPSKNHS